jgi:hypothetical protein
MEEFQQGYSKNQRKTIGIKLKSMGLKSKTYFPFILFFPFFCFFFFGFDNTVRFPDEKTVDMESVLLANSAQSFKNLKINSL